MSTTSATAHSYVAHTCATCEGHGATYSALRATANTCLDCDGTGRSIVRLDRITDADLDRLHNAVWAEVMERDQRRRGT